MAVIPGAIAYECPAETPKGRLIFRNQTALHALIQFNKQGAVTHRLAQIDEVNQTLANAAGKTEKLSCQLMVHGMDAVNKY